MLHFVDDISLPVDQNVEETKEDVKRDSLDCNLVRYLESVGNQSLNVPVGSASKVAQFENLEWILDFSVFNRLPSDANFARMERHVSPMPLHFQSEMQGMINDGEASGNSKPPLAPKEVVHDWRKFFRSKKF